ncbi:hypothetical protein [uncultured Treponema sp.]|uniref:hypothetical protein n=1 Tax=uncultured Treponema sp. TaxID=162155 RepID=UPI0025DBE6AB|nr:hypothetical protein [uncultured Treponema sp.]
MKKKVISFFVLVACCTLCFAQARKYRYMNVNNSGVVIMDFAKEIPKENLSDTLLALNTKEERFIAESGVRRLEPHFYSGRAQFMYADATKDPNNPDMKFIDSWSDVLAYVRGTK